MGAWTDEEDACLKLAISSIGLPAYQNQISWVEVAKLVPNRGAKSCRLRWDTQLSEDIDFSKFTDEEEAFILAYQAASGNKWAEMAKALSEKAKLTKKEKFRRTDNQVKNLWHCRHGKKQSNVSAVASGRPPPPPVPTASSTATTTSVAPQLDQHHPEKQPSQDERPTAEGELNETSKRDDSRDSSQEQLRMAEHKASTSSHQRQPQLGSGARDPRVDAARLATASRSPVQSGRTGKDSTLAELGKQKYWQRTALDRDAELWASRCMNAAQHLRRLPLPWKPAAGMTKLDQLAAVVQAELPDLELGCQTVAKMARGESKPKAWNAPHADPSQWVHNPPEKRVGPRTTGEAMTAAPRTPCPSNESKSARDATQRAEACTRGQAGQHRGDSTWQTYAQSGNSRKPAPEEQSDPDAVSAYTHNVSEEDRIFLPHPKKPRSSIRGRLADDSSGNDKRHSLTQFNNA